ncbi:MAG: amidohydrolase [Methanomicrobiales archaeon]|nr:amidohydrolase [Methanomicrobiales archaeon]
MRGETVGEELFRHRGPLLVRNVLIDQQVADICINEAGHIEAMGKGAETSLRGQDTLEIDGRGAIALPGLVNTHTHAAMTLLRGYADDMNLQEWLEQKIWPLEAHLKGDDVYWGTKLACLEMTKSGTIAFNDMYFFMKDAARAVIDSGMKAVLSYGFIDLGDEDRREREIHATEDVVNYLLGLKNPRIRPAVGPHAVYTVSDEGLRWLAEFSEVMGVAIHIHVSETEHEVQECLSKFGRRPPAYLDSCGILTPRTIAAHCCWIDKNECALLGKKGVHVSHNPQSNMKLAVNRAMPYPSLRKNNVNVTLGTDGCASNNSLDMFETMKCASLLQKFFWNSGTILPAKEALTLATSNGARALGFGPGKIAPGAPADIILIDRNGPCNTPLHNVESNVVYACNGSAVNTVICNGKVLMHHRTVPGEAGIIAGAARAAEQLLQRAFS